MLTNIDNVITAGVANLGLSDHHLNYIVIKKKHLVYGTTTFTSRKLNEFTLKLLESMVAQTDWGDNFMLHDITEFWASLYSKYITIGLLDTLWPRKIVCEGQMEQCLDHLPFVGTYEEKG